MRTAHPWIIGSTVIHRARGDEDPVWRAALVVVWAQNWILAPIWTQRGGFTRAP